MKKFVLGAIFALICGSALFAQTLKDGFFFAMDSNWTNNQKNQVVINVINGRIVSAAWNIISLDAGTPDHKAIARAGTDSAITTWAAQAKVVEDFLVSSQNVNATSVPGGPPNVKPFFDLVKRATDRRAVAVVKGNFHDGWHYAEEAEHDDFHTKNTVLITVVNGTIVDVLWNGILLGMPASVNPSKVITSLSNNNRGYPMPGSKRPWHLQAVDVAAELVKKQNPSSLTMLPNNKPDAISGVSIEINHFLEAARAALR